MTILDGHAQGSDADHRKKITDEKGQHEKRPFMVNDPKPLLSAVTIDMNHADQTMDGELESRSDPEHDRPPPAKRRNSLSSVYRGRSGSLSSDVSNYDEGSSIVNNEGYERPHIKYAGMITQAIVSTAGARISLRDLYDWIQETYPYFQTASRSWMSSIRHNLVTNTNLFFKLSDSPATSIWTAYPQTLLAFEEKQQIPQGTYNLLHSYIDRLIRDGLGQTPAPAENAWPIVRVRLSNATTTIMIRFAPSSSSSSAASSTASHSNTQSTLLFRPSQPVLLPSVVDHVVYDDPMLPTSSTVLNAPNQRPKSIDDILSLPTDSAFTNLETRTPSPQHLEGKLPEISPQKFHHGMEILPLDPKSHVSMSKKKTCVGVDLID